MKKNNAFTLMELLAVIALLGTILAIAIPKLLNNTSNEKDKIFKMSAINIIKDFNYKHLGEDFTSTTLLKLNLTTISSSDYDLDSSYICVVNDKTYIYLVGLGEFEGLICHGTVENMLCQEDIATISFVYNLNGGTTSQSFESSYAPNTKITLINPTKAGYTFTGWTVEGTGASLNGSELTTGIETTTITANWQRNTVTLTVNLNEGSTTQSFEETYYSLSTLSLINPTKEGYTFTGWTVEGTGASINGTELTIGTSATTITANWEINNPVYSYSCSNGSVGTSPYYIVYTGKCTVIDDGNDNWRVEFLTSGTLTLSKAVKVDIHAVGGGGSGAARGLTNYGSGGGGGGYVNTIFATDVASGEYDITIGAGGNSVTSTGGAYTGVDGIDGGSSSFGSICSAAGGKGGTYNDGSAVYSCGIGGAGGSGGGGGAKASRGIGGSGGTNGGNGEEGSTTDSGAGGTGSGVTTRDFGETTGTLRSGGGAGSGRSAGGVAGDSTAGDGAKAGTAGSGIANYGGGGGGSGGSSSSDSGCTSGAGGSGIVIIRNAR